MRKVLIFGNSGSGKSTLAKNLESQGLAHLDLDTIAWLPSVPPQRRPKAESQESLRGFVSENESWVIEGCYGDLLEFTTQWAGELIFLDLAVDECQENARQRPWEPHKYESKEAQDANLAMLLDWIAQYETRDDDFSRAAHQRLFEGFNGKKRHIKTRADLSL